MSGNSDIRCCSCAEPGVCPKGHTDGLMDVGLPPKPDDGRGYHELCYGFVECDACKAKPGSSVLCSGCLHNMERARIVREHVESADRWKEVAEALGLRRDELLRENNAQVLKRRAADANRLVTEHEAAELRRYVTSLEDTITDMGIRISELEGIEDGS